MTRSTELVAATFVFRGWLVVFTGGTVEVLNGEQDGQPMLKVEQGDWRPCVTHCRELIRLARGNQPTSNHERGRRKATKPSLKIARGTT